MSTVRFIHCADLHLDTPFRGLADVNTEVAAALNEATLRAWESIVDLAISEHVDFVVIAGDVYDSTDRSLRAQFEFRDGLKRLSDSCIPSFVAFGNHDPLNGWSHSLEWPQYTHLFGGREVDSCEVRRNGEAIATVHGISFLKADVKENLAARFVAPDCGLPSVAVLHCTVGATSEHEHYAPATVEELAAKGFSYWALGHVHTHRILRPASPAIVYSGCSQARQPNRTGAKGCCLVTLNDDTAPDIRFVPTDTVRFFNEKVDVSECSSIDGVRHTVVESCVTTAATEEERCTVGRLTLSGRTPLKQELTRGATLEDLAESIRTELFNREPWIWLERLTANVRSLYDIDQLGQQQDFAGDIVRAYSALLASEREMARFKEVIEREIVTSQVGKLTGTASADEFRGLVERAMHQTLDEVLQED